MTTNQFWNRKAHVNRVEQVGSNGDQFMEGPADGEKLDPDVRYAEVNYASCMAVGTSDKSVVDPSGGRN